MRDVQLIDIAGQKVGLAPGFQPRIDVLEYDQLVISLGSRINFSLVPGMKEHAIPFKYLGDAMRIRYEAVRALEEADIEVDPQEKRNLLTFVVAGGGLFGSGMYRRIARFPAARHVGLSESGPEGTSLYFVAEC